MLPPRTASPFRGRYAMFYVAAAMYAVLDVTLQSTAGAICGKSFEQAGRTVEVFGLWRTCIGVGSAVGFFISKSLGINNGTTSTQKQLAIEIAITATCGVLAVIGLLMFERCPPLLAPDGDKDQGGGGAKDDGGAAEGGSAAVASNRGNLGKAAGIHGGKAVARVEVEAEGGGSRGRGWRGSAGSREKESRLFSQHSLRKWNVNT